MLIEFSINAQRFGLKKAIDNVSQNEAILKFAHKHQVESFINDVMRERANRAKIQAMAKKLSPVYSCQSIRSKPMNGDQVSVDSLISQIDSGKVNVVLRHNALMTCHKSTNIADGEEQSLVDNQNFFNFAKAKLKQLKDLYLGAIKADYHILEQVFHIDESSKQQLNIVDPKSIRKFETGWKPWNDPFDLMALGAFKAVATCRVGQFLRLSDSIKYAALAGSQTEILSA